MLKKLSGLVLFAGLMLWLAPLGQAQFSTPSVNISNSAMDSMYPKICHVPGIATELVAWLETDGTNDYLYFAKSTNGAVTWSAPVQLSTAGQILGHSDDLKDYCAFSMEVADPYVHIVIQWRNDPSDDWDIWYIRSVDLGDTWDIYNDWVALTNNSNASQYPDVATAGDYVHVTYQDDWPGNLEIMYKRITNYGGGSVDQTRRLTFSTGNSYYPKIAVRESGYCVSVVYEDDTSGQYQVYYKHVDDYGAGPYQTKQLTSSTFWNGLPDIAVGTGSYDAYVYIVYQSFWPGNREVMYKRLDNYGYDGFNTYTARLTYSTTDSESNAIDWDTLYDYVHISYQDSWPGNNDIMYRKLSSGGGGGFTGQRVSWGTGDSSSSTVAASGAWAYVAWADDSSGNYEIYVKKGL
jgi:hypothetical protein